MRITSHEVCPVRAMAAAQESGVVTGWANDSTVIRDRWKVVRVSYTLIKNIFKDETPFWGTSIL